MAAGGSASCSFQCVDEGLKVSRPHPHIDIGDRGFVELTKSLALVGVFCWVGFEEDGYSAKFADVNGVDSFKAVDGETVYHDGGDREVNDGDGKGVFRFRHCTNAGVRRIVKLVSVVSG